MATCRWRQRLGYFVVESPSSGTPLETTLVIHWLRVHAFLQNKGLGFGPLIRENPIAKGAWWITVHRVSKSLTWLKQWRMSTSRELDPTCCSAKTRCSQINQSEEKKKSNTFGFQKLEEARKRPSPSSCRRTVAHINSVSLLQNCERINLCCFRLPSFWHFATSALGQVFGNT